MKIGHYSFHRVLILASLMLARPALPQQPGDGLALRGKARDVKIEHDGKDYVNVTVELNLEFANVGSKPIIFLQPQDNRPAEIFWLGGISLSLAKFLADRDGCNSAIWKS